MTQTVTTSTTERTTGGCYAFALEQDTDGGLWTMTYQGGRLIDAYGPVLAENIMENGVITNPDWWKDHNGRDYADPDAGEEMARIDAMATVVIAWNVPQGWNTLVACEVCERLHTRLDLYTVRWAGVTFTVCGDCEESHRLDNMEHVSPGGIVVYVVVAQEPCPNCGSTLTTMATNDEDDDETPIPDPDERVCIDCGRGFQVGHMHE